MNKKTIAILARSLLLSVPPTFAKSPHGANPEKAGATEGAVSSVAKEAASAVLDELEGKEAKGVARKEGSLPPGLAKRETLPPGLAKRETLPPGLQKGGAPPKRESLTKRIVKAIFRQTEESQKEKESKQG